MAMKDVNFHGVVYAVELYPFWKGYAARPFFVILLFLSHFDKWNNFKLDFENEKKILDFL